MLHYRTIQKTTHSEWIVFVHGAGGSIRTWNLQIPFLEQHFNLLLIDIRDHGLSKDIYPAYDVYSFSIITKDIKAVIDKVKIEKAHFMTLSFGSVIMQDFSMRYPELIDKIVIAGGIFKGTLMIRVFVQVARLMNIFFSYPTMYKVFSYLLMPKKRNQKARKIYQLQSQKLTQKEYMKWIGLYGEFFRLLKQFFHHQFNKPTHVFMGADDYVFLKGAKQFVKQQAHTSLQIYPKVGHICNIEHAEQFNEDVMRFLGKS